MQNLSDAVQGEHFYAQQQLLL